MRIAAILLALPILMGPACASAQPSTPSTNPTTAPTTSPSQAIDKLPHIKVDMQKKQVRVECQMLGIDAPLEFFCVLKGTNEHESVLRTEAMPSQIHFALLMMGLEAGEPVRFSESAKKWLPPHGPPVNISVEFEKDGRTIVMPAHRLMKAVHDNSEQPPHSWIFVGSRLMPDGVYAADVTGYVVSVVNFDLSLIDIPQLASNANETLEWRIDKSVAPPAGSAVTMVIEVTGAAALPPQMNEVQANPPPSAAIDQPIVKIGADGKIELNNHPVTRAQLVEQLKQMQRRRPVTVRLASVETQRDLAVAVASDIRELDISIESAPAEPAPAQTPAATDGDSLDAMKQRWQQAVAPHQNDLRSAAQAHYEVITQLRRQQQKLIDEADRIQRLIDELEKQYQDLTTPRPAPASSK